MVVRFFRGQAFRNTHENKAFDGLCRSLRAHMQASDDVRVVGNIVDGDRPLQIDALVLKRHAITIVDFKDWGGAITVGPETPWVHRETGLEVKGGSYANPFKQICAYREALRKDLQKANWPQQDYSHISGFVLFLRQTEFLPNPDDSFSVSTGHWFGAGDWADGVKHICHHASPKINLSAEQLDAIVSGMGVTPYVLRDSEKLPPAS